MVAGAFHQARVLWTGFSRPQQVVFVVLGIASFLAIFGLVYWANRPDFITLYAQLDPSDASAIVQRLKEGNIPYRLAGGGTQILVSSSRVHETRLSMANRGLPSQGVVGFEIFDQSKVGVTDFVQKLNYQRALQGELSRTISQLRQVRQARVHLVVPKPSLLTDREKSPTAAVVVNLRPGARLLREEIQGIVHMVSASVEGLAPEKVTVLDQAGRILSRRSEEEAPLISSTQLEFQRELERRVQSMVEDVVGANRAVVRVAAQLDLTRGERVEEHFYPTPVVRSEQRSTEESAGSPRESQGVVATHSNGALPEMEKTETTSSTNQTRSTKETESITYELGKVSERTILFGGEIKRLSVAVVLDGVYQVETAEDGTVRRAYVRRTAEDLEKIKTLVMRAVGFNASRGDEVEVVEMPFSNLAFDQGEGFGKQGVGWLEWWHGWTNLVEPVAKLVAFLVGLILILRLMVHPLLKILETHGGVGASYRELQERAMVSALQGGSGAAGGQGTPPGLPSTVGPKQKRHEELKHQLAEMTRSKPEPVVNVVRGWLAPKRG